MYTNYLKFIYSEKATKFCEILTLLLTVCTVIKSKVKISQNFVAFSEYMNFTKTFSLWVGLCFSPTSTVNKIIRSFPKLVLILWIFNLKFFSISCFFLLTLQSEWHYCKHWSLRDFRFSIFILASVWVILRNATTSFVAVRMAPKTAFSILSRQN